MTDVIAQIDAEIAKLMQAKELLSSSRTTVPVAAPVVKAGRGRPKGSKNAVKAAAKAPVKRQLSEAGRKAIAEAMKRRWAERRKQAAK